jgi:trimethylamine--corrinoid protein Co-methyltransferase
MVMLATLASGMDFIIHACGILDSFNIIGYEKFMLDEQIIMAAQHMLADLKLDDHAFGLEAIMSVEHGGQYLVTAHTVKNMRKALFVPGLSLHGGYGVWVKAGRKTLTELAREAVKKRLETYTQPPLEPESSALVEKYLLR